MSEEFNEVIDLVEKAQSKGTFNLSKVIKGVGFPSDVVEIYLDIESAYKLNEINEQISLTADQEVLAKLEAEAKELSDKILASKLLFNMRGIDQKHIEAIEKSTKKNGLDDDEWWIDYMCGLVAANIVSVEDADGNVDERLFEIDEIKELRGSIPAEAWNKLMSTMQKLTLATGYFQGLTDAGFLQKS